MRIHSAFRPLLLALALTGLSTTACFDSIAALDATPIGTTLTTASLAVTPSSVDIGSIGDSLVVTIIQPNSCGYQLGAGATLNGSTLDVTLSFSTQQAIPCAPTNGSTRYRIAVGPVSPGTYLVHAHVRTATPNDIEDTIVGQGTIVLAAP